MAVELYEVEAVEALVVRAAVVARQAYRLLLPGKHAGDAAGAVMHAGRVAAQRDVCSSLFISLPSVSAAPCHGSSADPSAAAFEGTPLSPAAALSRRDLQESCSMQAHTATIDATQIPAMIKDGQDSELPDQ